MRGKILILIIIYFSIFYSGCTFFCSHGYFQPTPREFIDFAQHAMESTSNFKEILMNSKFEKKDRAFSEDEIERQIILINMFKKSCGENLKVDEEESWISTVNDSRNDKIDTICSVIFSCKNPKYNGSNEFQNWQYVPEYIKFGSSWFKRKGVWIFDGFRFIPGVN